jgi:hypothetical protein
MGIDTVFGKFLLLEPDHLFQVHVLQMEHNIRIIMVKITHTPSRSKYILRFFSDTTLFNGFRCQRRLWPETSSLNNEETLCPVLQGISNMKQDPALLVIPAQAGIQNR